MPIKDLSFELATDVEFKYELNKNVQTNRNTLEFARIKRGNTTSILRGAYTQ